MQLTATRQLTEANTADYNIGNREQTSKQQITEKLQLKKRENEEQEANLKNDQHNKMS